MQKFSGIYMGRRKKHASETEAEMEGSGDDVEPQGLAFLAHEFHKSINQTESKLVIHLQENYEANHKGQTEITETLKKVDENLRNIDENQTRIVELLLQMTHKGKGPEAYDNKETGGSHGGNRYHSKHIPYHHSEGSHGGATPHGQIGSRATPRPYLPTFTDELTQHELDDFVEQMVQCTREYNDLSMTIQREMSLDQYCQLKFRNKPRPNHRSNYKFERKAGKMEIPYFDGSAKMTAQAWVQKLDTYLQLNLMREMEAIKFATMYLDGKAHDWWYHGLTTLGHNQIVAYTEFTQRLIDRFDQGDPELHFRELTQLRQTRTPKVYIEEFQRLAVMVQDVSQTRLMMLFIEGLMGPLKGWVKAFKPTNLQEAIWNTRDLGPTAKPKCVPRPPLKAGGRDQRPPMNPRGRDPRGFDRGRGRMKYSTHTILHSSEVPSLIQESSRSVLVRRTIA
jgi:hypothetical protein